MTPTAVLLGGANRLVTLSGAGLVSGTYALVASGTTCSLDAASGTSVTESSVSATSVVVGVSTDAAVAASQAYSLSVCFTCIVVV